MASISTILHYTYGGSTYGTMTLEVTLGPKRDGSSYWVDLKVTTSDYLSNNYYGGQCKVYTDYQYDGSDYGKKNYVELDTGRVGNSSGLFPSRQGMTWTKRTWYPSGDKVKFWLGGALYASNIQWASAVTLDIPVINNIEGGFESQVQSYFSNEVSLSFSAEVDKPDYTYTITKAGCSGARNTIYASSNDIQFVKQGNEISFENGKLYFGPSTLNEGEEYSFFITINDSHGYAKTFYTTDKSTKIKALPTPIFSNIDFNIREIEGPITIGATFPDGINWSEYGYSEAPTITGYNLYEQTSTDANLDLDYIWGRDWFDKTKKNDYPITIFFSTSSVIPLPPSFNTLLTIDPIVNQFLSVGRLFDNNDIWEGNMSEIELEGLYNEGQYNLTVQVRREVDGPFIDYYTREAFYEATKRTEAGTIQFDQYIVPELSNSGNRAFKVLINGETISSQDGYKAHKFMAASGFISSVKKFQENCTIKYTAIPGFGDGDSGSITNNWEIYNGNNLIYESSSASTPSFGNDKTLTFTPTPLITLGSEFYTIKITSTKGSITKEFVSDVYVDTSSIPPLSLAPGQVIINGDDADPTASWVLNIHSVEGKNRILLDNDIIISFGTWRPPSQSQS